MKTSILLFISIVICQISFGQEVILNSTIIATAGNNNSAEQNTSSINISKWKIGEVHLIVLQQNKLNRLPETNWDVNSYPNPFKQILNLSFKTEGINDYTIQVTDIAGKKQWLNKNVTITQDELMFIERTPEIKENIEKELGYYYLNKELEETKQK